MALSKSQFIDTYRERRKDSKRFWEHWRKTAIEEFDFICGKQWLDEDERLLKSEDRVAVTFNYSEKMIDAVVGAEVSNRQEATYKPRGMEDAGYAEMMNNGAKWVRDECNAEDEESDAFRDMLICGMGWTDTHLSYDEDQDGKLIEERCDPLEMFSDPAASKPSLSDRRYDGREWWTDEKEARIRWPKTTLFSDNSDSESPGTDVITRGRRYAEGEEDEHDRHKGQVKITCYECVELEPIYRILLNGQIQEMSVEDYNKYADVLTAAKAETIKQNKRIYYRGYFTGETCLEFDKSPCQDGFMYQCMTGKRDRNRNTWYGLTRVMKDPQRWANKWLSQILHIINSNAKGGLMAEVNAFVDAKKAQEEWAKPDSITLFKEGALSGKKVQEKGMSPFPTGLDKLMQFALGSLPMVTGINLEALGLANREQAGVLEQQRKQAAYGLLAPIFDSLRRFRKIQGRVMMHMMDRYISDGRMIRISPDSAESMPLRKLPDTLKYDIIVDQSPNAPDVKERTWATLENLVPAMLKAGVPVPPDLLDYAPLPVALATKWKAFAQQNPPPDPKMQQMQQQLQQLTEENQQLKQDQSNEQAQIAMKGQQMQDEMSLKRQIAMDELQLKRDLALEEMRLTREQMQQEMQLADEKADNDLAIANKKADTANEVARIAARNKPKPNGAAHA